MTWQILQGDVFDTLATIPPGSVDAVVTSPPYWQLRSYLPKGHALKRYELGSEPTPAEYIANQVRVFGLVRQAMADHAVCFVNIGDTYAGGSQGYRPGQGKVNGKGANRDGAYTDDLDPGNLCLIPQRLAISLQDAGWLVRSVVVWSKPSPMPSSIAGWCWRRCRVKLEGHWTADNPHPDQRAETERVFQNQTNTKAKWADCPGCKKCIPNGGYRLRRGSWRPTSSWEPVIMLAKSERYFGDGEPVKQTGKSDRGGSYSDFARASKEAPVPGSNQKQHRLNGDATINTGTANLRDVWSIAAEPLNEDHFAAFPTELVTRCLKASVSEKGYCRSCGAPWVRMIDSEQVKRVRPNALTTRHHQGNGVNSCDNTVAGVKSRTLGWRQSCKCQDATPRPGLVLDPFCGSGRTGVAARRLGLDFVGCELSEAYIEIANRQIEAALRKVKRAKRGKKAASLF